jgi:hypothetical protein
MNHYRLYCQAGRLIDTDMHTVQATAPLFECLCRAIYHFRAATLLAMPVWRLETKKSGAVGYLAAGSGD